MRRSHSLIVLIVLLLAPGLTLPAHASGLLVPTDRTIPPLRVTDHLVDVKIHDQVALTSLTQTFRNDTNRRLEANYIFPIPEQADLTDFQMSFNGKMVKGEVLPAQEARAIYESIVRQTKDPGLIEFIGRRLLRMRVFPIEPHSNTTISLKYQQVCRPISGMRGYHYPLRTSKTSGQAYGTVRFTVQIDTASPLKSIWSPTHAVETVRDGDYGAKVAYEASGGSLEDDFILLYNTDQSDLGMSVIAHKPETNSTGHFLLILTPKQLWPKDEHQPQDVVFVVDTSGSMSGEKLTQAKAALKYCVDQLHERDRFSVVRFSTGFDVLFDEVSDATAQNKKAAHDFVAGFNAAGGTNIADTLSHVMTMRPVAIGGPPHSGPPAKPARPFVIVFVTDGQGNRQPDEILSTLTKATPQSNQVRIFPFGVGHDVNTMLLDRLATSYTGRPSYVQPGENLELVLGDFFSVISQPVLTNLKLTLPNIAATERFPVMIGDLYHGQQITIAGQFNTPATGPVKITAQRGGERIEYSWPNVAFANTAEADYVPSVWAGRKIAWMIDQIRLHGETQEQLNEIMELSMKYGIQTPYTSWLVTPEGRPMRTGRPLAQFADGDTIRRRGEQLNRLRGIAGAEAEAQPPGGGGRGRGGLGGGGGGFGGGGFDRSREMSLAWTSPNSRERLSLEEAELARFETSGKAATVIARVQDQLRNRESKDDGRLDESILARREINKRWYNRIGLFLVDETVDEKTTMTVVQFASDAYFELVMARPDLRRVLSTSRFAVVGMTKGHAIVVVDSPQTKDAITEFTDKQREQFGLGGG